MDINECLHCVNQFVDSGLTGSISKHERTLFGADQAASASYCESTGIDDSLIAAAFTVKRAAAQISVIIHCIGIISVLPKILRVGEAVESLSLGAGNTGRKFDLETTERVAEFKFIEWQGRDTIRQNGLFKDYFELAEAETKKDRELYVVDTTRPLQFLYGRRALSSVLSKNRAVSDRFEKLYGDRFRVVRDYVQFREDRVKLIDLRDVSPAFSV